MAAFFFQEDVFPSPEDLIGKGMNAAESRDACNQVLAALQDFDPFTASEVEVLLRSMAEEMSLKPGQLFGILRVAVTGQKVSPPLFETMEIIGKDDTLRRISRASQMLAE
jgi:glutamyl-tRNA synthetase